MSHEGLPGKDLKTGEQIVLPDNVEVYFCISGNRERPRGALCMAQRARMEEWHKAYPAMRLGLWLYDGFPAEFARNGGFQCVPGYMAHDQAEQFRFFKKMNAAVGIFNCGLNGEIHQFLSYQLMREPELDADALLNRYFAQYGAAAKPLRKFYDLVEERYCNEKYRPDGVSDRSTKSFWGVRCPVEVMEKLGAWMEEAKALAKTDEEKARVKLFEIENWRYMKKGSDEYVKRTSSPTPKWTAKRIADANGDLDKVDWASLPLQDSPLYERGTDKVVDPKLIAVETRMAYDSTHFYLELVQVRDLKNLHISRKINPYDDWEILFSCQQAQPYRCYFCDPDNRLLASSWGEVNWRQGVPSLEANKHKAYFAECKSILEQPNRWIERIAFPLDKMLDKPITAGCSFYMNPVTVLNTNVCPGNGPFRIFSTVSYSTVHTCDRSALVTLEK